MPPMTIQNDFDTLPPDAQRQVVDFIAFIKSRYSHQNTGHSNNTFTKPTTLFERLSTVEKISAEPDLSENHDAYASGGDNA